jgi:hypothetical protein
MQYDGFSQGVGVIDNLVEILSGTAQMIAVMNVEPAHIHRDRGISTVSV